MRRRLQNLFMYLPSQIIKTIVHSLSQKTHISKLQIATPPFFFFASVMNNSFGATKKDKRTNSSKSLQIRRPKFVIHGK
jgi:hypothetical protein